MRRTDKALADMRANPRADWRIGELESVAKAFGANIRRPGGSHVIFEHPAVMAALSVPARRKIKPVYVRRFVEWIDAIRGNRDEEEA